MISILSILLLISAFIFLDREKAYGSIIGSILFPLFVFLTTSITNQISFGNDRMLAAIFGGLFSGFGAGLAFKMSCNTGGTDILQEIMSKYAKISIGKQKL